MMTRFLACLCFFSLLLSPAVYAEPTPATLLVGGKTVPFVVSPFVGADGQVWGPVDAVRLMSAEFVADTRAKSVTVTGANGRKISVPYTSVSGRYCVPLQKVALALGASADWQPTTRVLTVRARLEMVRQDDGALSVYTSYPVYYTVRTLDKPSRLYVDLFGLDLAAAPANVPASGDVTAIRSGQFNFNTVRISIDLKKRATFKVQSGVQTSRVQIALNAPGGRTTAPEGGGGLATMPVKPLPPVAVVNPPAPVLPTVPAGSVRITGVELKSVGDTLSQIVISASGPAKYRTETLDNPNRLAFDLAGATLDPSVAATLSASDNPVIKAIRTGVLRAGGAQFGRVVVDLARLVGFTITQQAGDGGAMTYLINLRMPRQASQNGGNSLAGKIVVVDPGHGGHDTGSGDAPPYEKQLTLEIGRRLRDTLTQNGATVYMTRADDTFISVMSRPQVAVNRQADYFVSVHCDSFGARGARNLRSGTTVYFHAQNPAGRALARSIVNRVAEVSGIPAVGIKSDTIRFQTGFGVLRGSPMPAVLVECGYINSDADLAKLRNSDAQQHIAEGIVAGLRDFIAERAAP